MLSHHIFKCICSNIPFLERFFIHILITTVLEIYTVLVVANPLTLLYDIY